MQILNLHNLEILDHFARGLKLSLFERVMEQAPKTFDNAARFAEHGGLEQ